MTGNPILVGLGVCDPQIRIYGEDAYLYATHDNAPDNAFYRMDDWWIWRSSDLVHWDHVGTVTPEETYFGKPSGECWATDAIRRHDKYYFYFSMGPENIGVLVSDSPNGPWSDPLGQPLIPKGLVPTDARDPGILQEEDGTSYLVFGTWDFYIARLNEDMVSLAEVPRLIVMDQQMGPYGAGKLDDKPFLHQYNGKYYLSWGCYYATADSVYGPYTYQDSVIVAERTDPEFQNGLTMDRHSSFFTLHNQWYFACNDQSFPGSSSYFRNTVLSTVHYRDNGQIEPIFLRRIGVGQYDARQPQIEAEEYFRLVQGTKAECPEGGFEVRGLRHGSWLVYPNVSPLPVRSPVSFRISSDSVSGGMIEIRQGQPDGPLLGVCPFEATGGWTSYQTITTQLDHLSEQIDICLVITADQPGEKELLRLNWISFL